MSNQKTIKVGDIVKPACDGETRNWSMLRGRILNVWMSGREERAEIKWNHDGSSFGTMLATDLLEVVS